MAKPGDDWRARAVVSFPEIRDELEDEEDIFSVGILFSELESMVRTAHRENDGDLLKRIYGYASWAREQSDSEIRNAVGVSFYEHLFDERWMRPLVVPWINDRIVADSMGLWAFQLSPADLEEVRQLLVRGGLTHAKGQKRRKR